MVLTALIISLLVIVLIFIISALPLYFAVKFLGGKTTLFKTIIVAFLTGIITFAINSQFKFGGLIAFLVLVLIYREFFKLKWWKALLVWFVQLVFVALFTFIAIVISGLIGLSLIALI